MAEKKEHTFVAANPSAAKPDGSNGPVLTPAKPVGNASSKRLVAIILWVVALCFEILAFLALIGKLHFINFIQMPVQVIIFLVLDLACVIIGSQFWKKANHIKPASEKNKVKFWLWNNMGVIVCVICFLPIIILFLTNKELDKKTKAIAVVVAVIALLIGFVSSYDFNPVSVEQQTAAVDVFGEDTVYWTKYGKVYHSDSDCSALNRSEELNYGTVEEAIANNRVRLCSFCAKKNDITGVATEGD